MWYDERSEAFVPDPEFWMSWHVCQVKALVSRGSFCKNNSGKPKGENILHDSHERWCPHFNSLLKKQKTPSQNRTLLQKKLNCCGEAL